MKARSWTAMLAVGLVGCVNAAEPVDGEIGELRAGKGAAVDRVVSYAYAGSPTGGPTFGDVFEPQIAAAVRAYGLDLGTLDSQLSLIEHTRDDIDPAKDLVFLWLGGIDYLTVERNPQLPPQRIVAAMERLYALGLRRFVVPNLPRLSATPAVSSSPEAAAGLDFLIGAHNLILPPALLAFTLAHPDAKVIPVDAFSVSLGLPFDPRFENHTESCLDVGLPAGADCAGWLYLDKIHYNTLAQQSFAQAAAAAVTLLDPRPVRRLLVLGDSLSDVGINFDVTERVLGAGTPPAPLYFERRFSNGPLVVDQLADLLGVPRSQAFEQPFVGSLTATSLQPGVLAGELAVDGDVLVPAALGPGTCGLAVLEIGPVTCVYLPENGRLVRSVCSHGKKSNQRVRAEEVHLTVLGSSLTSFTAPILHYE